ncbi:MAG: GNAT family N-acetyltransferase [Chitinophagaceae bacterium]|nr:GNAT family N-acetyltransferase [Chitinophagaceae bacterium]
MKKNNITQIDPSNKPALKKFVSLERKLMKGYPFYISEIDSDVTKFLNRRAMEAKDMEFGLFIASKSGRDVARCAAIINKRFQAEKQPGAGFIGFFGAAENCRLEVEDMIQEAEDWLKEKGVTKIIAPVNGGPPNSIGFVVRTFNEEPMFPFAWNPPYYQEYFENLNYRPAYPMWIYEIDFSSEKYRTAKQKYSAYDTVSIRTVSKKNWDEDMAIIIDLLNETFVEEWEFTKMTYAETKDFFGAMKTILAPQQMLIAEADGKPVGFCFALPDLTPLFRSFKGRLGLIQIFKLMTRAKKFHRAGILAIGITKEYRGKGVSKAMAMKLYGYHESLGLKSSLYYTVNERNMASRGFAESIGGKGKLVYQVYDKVLS